MKKQFTAFLMVVMISVFFTTAINAQEIKTIQAKASVINDEASLKNALENATGETILEIEGGSEIILTNSLTINTTTLTKVTFKSTTLTPVVIKHANTKRHLEVSGTNSIDLSFDNVILSGDTTLNTTSGGIVISSGGTTNKIDGLVVKDNIVKGGSTGLIDFKVKNSALTISNAIFTNNKIIERFATGSTIVYFDVVGSNITMNNVLFENNTTANQNGTIIALYNDNATTNFTNITLKNNTSAGKAGGIKYIGYKNAVLNISGSEFSNNKNNESTAGAIDLVHRDQSITTIKNSKFINNYGYRGGGAIQLSAQQTTTSLEIYNVEFTSNKAGRIEYDPNTGVQTGLPSTAGAIGVTQMEGKSDLTIKNSQFNYNEAGSAGALSIYNDYDGETKLLIDNTEFNGNIADYHSGAIDFNYANDTNVAGLYTIINSSIKNNIVTGKDLGPGYNIGGYGGAIEFYNLASYPDLLKLNTVTFSGNSSKYPNIWNYDANSTNGLNKMYSSNIINTSFSNSSVDYIGKYNNVFNGDDIYLDTNAVTYFKLNKDNLTDLALENYNVDNLSYDSFKSNQIIEPIKPVASNYTFLGWYDENDKKWDFASDTQEGKTNFYLYAKWEKKSEYTITYDLNEGPTNENNQIKLSEKSFEDEKIASPGNAAWKNVANFSGWYLKDQNGQLTKKWDFENDAVKSDFTLYARWLVNVNFVVDNKTASNYPTMTIERKLSYNEAKKVSTKSNTNSKELIWYYDKALTKKVNLNSPITKHTTFYSSTKIIDNTDGDNNSAILPSTGTYGLSIILLVLVTSLGGVVILKRKY